jgi:hypothetical protein
MPALWCWGMLVAPLLLIAPQVAWAQADTLAPALFSAGSGSLPVSWRPLMFPKIPSHTRYEMFRDGEDSPWVVRAESHSSASGLIHDIRIDLEQFPILRWRWKVENVLTRGDARSKKGDDYPARIYLTFDVHSEDLGLWERTALGLARRIYGTVPGRAINYIWASSVAEGTVLDSPYVGRFTKLVAIESGSRYLGKWRSEERNVYRDYVSFYGKAPPPVVGVAIMTDSDDTGESGVAFYGDIEFAIEPASIREIPTSQKLR